MTVGRSVGIVCLCPRQKKYMYICYSELCYFVQHNSSRLIIHRNKDHEQKKLFSGFFSRRREKERLRKEACNFHVEWMMISRDIHVNSGELCVSSIFFLFGSLQFDLISWMTHHTYQMCVLYMCDWHV